jgi:AraC family carnitine catabolism transcriptional activator
MKRMKHLRLAYARSLVQHSDFPITEVASSVGYERVHELSRDYRKHFGIAPTFDRKRGPDYPSVKSHLFLSETT